MSWIQPNTKLYLLRDIPLDETYENTILFDSKNAQYVYFTSSYHIKYSFDAVPNTMTYQRVNRNTIRVNVLCDNIYDCNYLMFQNTAYGDKWFYAFIMQVNYINDSVTEIVYEIDVMQTWMFDYNLEECFVEREHSATDNVGDNLQDENLPTGEYVLGADFNVDSFFDDYMIVIASTYDLMSIQAPRPFSEGAFYRGIYSGVHYYTIPVNMQNLAQTASVIQAYINDTYTVWGDRSDSFICMYMTHKMTYIENQENVQPSFEKGITVKTSGAVFADYSGDANAYTPHNKKLYTYPYNFFYATNFKNVSEAFPYEYFDYAQYDNQHSQNMVYIVGDGSFVGNPAMIFYPRYYKGGGYKCLDYGMMLDGYPQCAFNTDSFKAWLAQMAIPIAALGVAGLLTGGAAIGAGMAAGAAVAGSTTALATVGTSLSTEVLANNVGGMGASVAKGAVTPTAIGIPDTAKSTIHRAIVNKLREGINAFKNPLHTHGVDSGSALIANHSFGFGFGNKHIRKEYAKIIDEYFDMYGYATNRVKVPNIRVRNHWTYTKTVGCVVRGRIPKDAEVQICSIFDNGIRFWKDGSKIGMYSAYAPTNTPVSP